MLLPAFAFKAFAADGVISEGKKYEIEYTTPIENAYPNKKYKSEKKLTDGVKASNPSYSDPAFLELYRGTSVSVTIDLKSVMAVSAVTIGELQQKRAGIVCSRYLEVYVSEDGENFGFAGRVDDKLSITGTQAKRVELKVQLDKSYKARYVRAVFSSDIFTYVDEVSVYGNDDISSAATAEPITVEAKDFSGDIDGINSICLMYLAAEYTTEMTKYYFAYHDEQGNIKDAMFDSLLYLGMPSTSAEDGYMRQADMQRFVSNAFAPDINVGALNTVVGEYKDELGYGADYKYPIFIAVPYIGFYSGQFGIIDGKNAFSNSLESRTAIIKWYIDYVEQQFAACNFNNLEIKGFYWFEEGINHSISSHEAELIENFNDIAHEKGYKTMWIPYYSSCGIDVAKSLGFDSVTMQSGYAFDGGEEVGQSNEKTVKDAAATAKKFGLNGIEFEVDIYKSEYAKRFTKYVSAAYGAGLMEKGMITMYQVGDNLYRSALQSGATREIYNLTYEYISGQYKEAAPVIKEGATVTLPVESITSGKLEVSDADNKKSELKIAEIEKPEGIYFFAEGNGYFEVQTYGSKPGTYVAKLSVTDGNNISNTVEITVIVEGDENAENNESESNDSTKDNSSNVLVIILIIVGGLIVLAAIAFALLKFVLHKKQ